MEGDVALFLWKTVRAIDLWVELPPQARSDAFDPAGYPARIEQISVLDLSSELREALETGAEVLRGGSVRPASLVDACTTISRWAEDKGAVGTSLEFAQAAARLQPRIATLSLEVGRLATECGQIARAESWYRHAIFTARQTRDWTSFAQGFLEQGRLQVRRENHAAARTAFIRALRISIRHSLGLLAATASHEIVAIARQTRQTSEVPRHARAALRGYGSDRRRLQALARTLSAYLLDRGYFAESRRLLDALPDDNETPTDRFERAAAFAQVDAALGDADGYAEAMDRVSAVLEQHPALEVPPAVWVGLLRAAAWSADSAAAEMLEPHARRAALARSDEHTLEEIAWLADPDAEPPELRIRRAAAPLRSLIAELEDALDHAGAV